jgi:hypothetical protein
MNMLYESVKERGSTIIVPSSAVDSMNLGGLSGIAALAKAGEPTPGESTSADESRQSPEGSAA